MQDITTTIDQFFENIKSQKRKKALGDFSSYIGEQIKTLFGEGQIITADQQTQEYFEFKALSTIRKLNNSYNKNGDNKDFHQNLPEILTAIVSPLPEKRRKAFIDMMFQSTLTPEEKEEKVWQEIQRLNQKYQQSNENTQETICGALVGELNRLFSENQIPIESQKRIIQAIMQLKWFNKFQTLALEKIEVYKKLGEFLKPLCQPSKSTTKQTKQQKHMFFSQSTQPTTILPFSKVYQLIEKSLESTKITKRIEIDGKIVDLVELGEGGLSKTYWYLDGGKKYVVKISKNKGKNPFCPEKAANPLFQQEEKNLRRIEGENAGILYIPGTGNTPAMLRMPYKGLDVLDFFHQLSQFDFDKNTELFVFYQFALSSINCFKAFHEKGWFHGDIKLENIAINEKGEVSPIDVSFSDTRTSEKKYGVEGMKKYIIDMDEICEGEWKEKYKERLDNMSLLVSIAMAASALKGKTELLGSVENHLSRLNSLLSKTGLNPGLFLGEYYNHTNLLVLRLIELDKKEKGSYEYNVLRSDIDRDVRDLGLDKTYRGDNLLEAISEEAKQFLRANQAKQTAAPVATFTSRKQ
jgi:hypothetical protein